MKAARLMSSLSRQGTLHYICFNHKSPLFLKKYKKEKKKIKCKCGCEVKPYWFRPPYWFKPFDPDECHVKEVMEGVG